MSYYSSLVRKVSDSADRAFADGLRALRFMGPTTHNGGSYTGFWSVDQESDSSVWSLVVDVEGDSVTVSVVRTPASSPDSESVLGEWAGSTTDSMLDSVGRAQEYLTKFASHGDYSVLYDLLDSAFASQDEVQALDYRPLQLQEAVKSRRVYVLHGVSYPVSDRVLAGVIREGANAKGYVTVALRGHGVTSCSYDELYVYFGGQSS